MTEQLALIIDQKTDTATTLFGEVQVAGQATQTRTYYESLKYWAEFTVAWLWHSSRIGSVRTRERYLDVLLDFFGQNGKFDEMPMDTDQQRMERLATVFDASPIKPWLVDARTATAYKISMENRFHMTGRRERRGKRGKMLERGSKQATPLSPKSIANALAVLSSFYKRAIAYPIYKAGVEAALFERSNPFDAVDRPKFKIMFAREAMTEDEVNGVLGVIPANTANGAMHFALLLAYALSGRRNSEIRNTRFGDFKLADGKCWLTWRGKHHQDGETNEFPMAAWQAIEDFLRFSGRLETIRPDEYIFVALSDRAARLGHAGYEPGKEPISISEVNRIFKVYLRKAGIKHDYVIHSLRHTVAKRLLDAGASIEQVKEVLGHANIATTLIYTEEPDHELPAEMARYEDKLGVHRLMENRSRMLG